MKRSDFRVKEYRGKFYIERRVEAEVKTIKEHFWVLPIKYERKIIVSWERVDDYGNVVLPPRTIREVRRFLDRRLPYFKTLQKALKKIEEFFQEPKYHYLK